MPRPPNPGLAPSEWILMLAIWEAMAEDDRDVSLEVIIQQIRAFGLEDQPSEGAIKTTLSRLVNQKNLVVVTALDTDRGLPGRQPQFYRPLLTYQQALLRVTEDFRAKFLFHAPQPQVLRTTIQELADSLKG